MGRSCYAKLLIACAALALLAPCTSTPTLAAEDVARYYEPNRCGPIALFVVCRVYEIDTTLDELCDLAGLHRDGTSIAGLVSAARAKGLEPSALHSSIAHLRRLGGPAIIDFPTGHFAVFLGWKEGRAVVFDLPEGKRAVSAETLESKWGKHVITFSKTASRENR